MVVDTAMYTLHGIFAALWTGSIVFVTAAVLPLAASGNLSPGDFGSVVNKLRWITRISALVTLLSGGHLAGVLYTTATLTETTRGYLVIAMLVFWLGLAATIEIGSSRAMAGVDAKKIREPARDAKPLYYAACVLAIGLLVTAGLLGTPSPIL
ncbi:MAG: transporter [Natronomonas sp.]